MEVNILHYNVRKSPGVLNTLLFNRNIANYDVLAIQKPATRISIADPICLLRSLWHLARGATVDRACFYVNKKIAQAKRRLIEHETPDLLTLALNTDTGILQIYNVYNPSLQYRQDPGYVRFLTVLRGVLKTQKQYIVLEDFNLYYLS